MKSKNKVSLAAIFFLLVAFTRAEAELSYSVTDLGTLGGTASQANGVAGRGGTNAAGMIVGSSTASDKSERAFLYANGKMFDLNTLCDLSTSDFQILTVATSISDSCLIIGEGITTSGEKHAFLLTPRPVNGGQWSYACCQWVWIQQGGGWWWESNCGCYKWHGPPGRHPPCPLEPPPCWWYPLPCPCPPGCPPPTTPEPPPPPPPQLPNQPPPPPTTSNPPRHPQLPNEPPPPPQLPNQPPPPQLPPPVQIVPPHVNTWTPPPPPTPTYKGVPVKVRPTLTPTTNTSTSHVRGTRTRKKSTTSSAPQNVNPAPHVQSEPTPSGGEKSTRRGKESAPQNVNPAPHVQSEPMPSGGEKSTRRGKDKPAPTPSEKKPSRAPFRNTSETQDY